ncbi:MAG: CoA transferase [Chloroflexi bacterium]|nr:CoA transferase [Chloroflexota bacterium]
MRRLPLEGIRVLDATHFWAGPSATGILGDLGAQVVKVESIQRYDAGRTLQVDLSQEKGYERAPAFQAFNRNKLGVTLNLGDERGVRAFRALARVSDLVMENFSAGVMDRLGVGYQALRRENPTLVMISMSGYGATGPWRSYVAFATPIAQVSGIAHLTGYQGGPPLSRFSASGVDPIVGLFGAMAALVALHQRRRTGRGFYLDFSQHEAIVSLMGTPLMDYVLNGRNQARQGDRNPVAAPHGCYPSRGEDRWVSIAVFNDDQWERLCHALENPEWCRDRRFADAVGRHRHQDDLDQHITRWTSQRDAQETARLLQEAGVPASPVRNCREVLDDSHLEAREFFLEMDHPVAGRHRQPRHPVLYSKTQPPPPRPAPLLGEHNQAILSGLLGLSRETLEELEQDQVIGTVPLRTKV